MAVLKILYIELLYNPAISTYETYKNWCIKNIWIVETTQMSINWWKDKQNVLYPYIGILFGNKKEWSTDTHSKDEPQKHCVNEESQAKGHILYDSIYIKCPE